MSRQGFCRGLPKFCGMSVVGGDGVVLVPARQAALVGEGDAGVGASLATRCVGVAAEKAAVSATSGALE
jgi:hypothetical protein